MAIGMHVTYVKLQRECGQRKTTEETFEGGKEK